MHDIAHITMTTGDVARQGREAIAEDVMAEVVPWLASALASGQRAPIPAVPGGYSALALQHDGALIVTVYGPTPELGEPMPLATFGVATSARHATPLWDMLVQSQPGVRPGLRQPATPWCAVVPYLSLLLHAEAVSWLGDFERCAAWAWVTRHPALEGVL